MIGRTNAGGGGGVGGSELVIVGGTTSPAKANHNTIWINTDKEITSYVLSATEPANPVEGMVWVTIGDSGNIVVISPVGGDWITVYPLSAKQYVSGDWEDVTAMSYQNGEWVSWITYLYNNGEENTELIGIWTAAAKTTSGSGTKPNAYAPTITNNGTSKTISLTHSSGTFRKGMCYTSQKIDLSGFTKITLKATDVVVDNANYATLDFVIWSAIGEYINQNIVAKVAVTGGDTECSIDVSALKDSYHIGFDLNSNDTTTVKLTVKEIYCS